MSRWPALAGPGGTVADQTSEMPQQGVPVHDLTLVSSSRRAAEVMSVVRLTTTGDSVMTSATLHVIALLSQNTQHKVIQRPDAVMKCAHPATLKHERTRLLHG